MFRRKEPEDELLLPPTPESLNDSDREWIRSVMAQMPRQTHAALCEDYSAIYLKYSTDINIPPTKRTNVARKHANQWLLTKFQRYKEIIDQRKNIDILYPKSRPF